jgi:post-segregation antitoxin (ccd killing protein)
MTRRSRQKASPAKRRTTLTLPADSLLQAERIARTRKVNLSTVIAEALGEGLRMHAAAERSEEVLSAYKRAFTGFSAEETPLLDGIWLEDPRARS